jgi:plastocyanin
MRRYVMAAALLVIAGCGEPDPDREPGPRTLEGFDFEVDDTVVVDESGFDPTTVTVSAGDVIELRNDGDERHTFTADEGRFETGTLEPGEATTVVLDDPGRVTYHDALAPENAGVIEVVARRSPAQDE